MIRIATQSICDRCGKKARKPGFVLCAQCLEKQQADLNQIPMYDSPGQRLEANHDLLYKIVTLATNLCNNKRFKEAQQVMQLL